MIEEGLDCSKYYSLLKQTTNYDLALAIVDVLDNKVLSQSDDVNRPFLKWTRNIDNHDVQSRNEETQQANYALSASEILNVTQLKLGAEEPLRYQLVALISAPDLTSVDLSDETVVTAISDVAGFIELDYNTSILTNGMSDELAARYEELNLLYGIDSGFVSGAADNSYEMYDKIVGACFEYMSVDIACLILPDEHLLVVKNSDSLSKKRLNTVLNKFQGPLYSFIAVEQETLVVNKDEVVDWADLQLGIDYKYVAIPVFKAAGRMAGILIIANDDKRKSFTNSDRKLCEVLAAEISKVTQSRYDALTGLLNRKGFEQQLNHSIRQSHEQSKRSALLFIDIDRFQSINELSGHNAGDVLLSQLGSLLPEHIRVTDSLARLSGDDFTIILNDCPPGKALTIAEKISDQVKSFRFVFLDKIFDITVSIGLYVFGEKDEDGDAVLVAAESACFTAKELGRGQIRVYEEKDTIMTQRRDDVLWVSRIHNAIEENRFKLYRQLIQSTHEGTSHQEHYEILLRMVDEEGNILSPVSFIPAAERYDQMTKVDRWVISKSLETMVAHDKKVGNEELYLSINLSGQSLCEDGFAEFIINTVKRYKIKPERVCFEVTETAAIINLSYALKFMAKLKSIGCEFSLDDFGSGMSSFSYLKSLPVDYLKIDGHFVKTMLQDPVDKAMVESIHRIGHVMGLQTIAEFVEDVEMIEVLRTLGVDYVQGYALGKPEPFEVQVN
ncbi:MAG: EAL domain-containing protein [Cycloclasticus sp.]